MKKCVLSKGTPPFMYLYGALIVHWIVLSSHIHFIQLLFDLDGFLYTVPNILDACDLNQIGCHCFFTLEMKLIKGISNLFQRINTQ
jgi:hypothetical protein